jgi:hypothetical protein
VLTPNNNHLKKHNFFSPANNNISHPKGGDLCCYVDGCVVLVCRRVDVLLIVLCVEDRRCYVDVLVTVLVCKLMNCGADVLVTVLVCLIVSMS